MKNSVVSEHDNVRLEDVYTPHQQIMDLIQTATLSLQNSRSFRGERPIKWPAIKATDLLLQNSWLPLMIKVIIFKAPIF